MRSAAEPRGRVLRPSHAHAATRFTLKVIDKLEIYENNRIYRIFEIFVNFVLFSFIVALYRYFDQRGAGV